VTYRTIGLLSLATVTLLDKLTDDVVVWSGLFVLATAVMFVAILKTEPPNPIGPGNATSRVQSRNKA
jgi:hypothetical protein